MMSMTGFGQASFAVDDRAYGVEVRSVNNRFLDVRLHLPWTDAELESRLRDVVRARIARGRVDLAVKQREGEGAGDAVRLNPPVARALVKAVQELTELLGDADLTVASRLLPPPRDLLVVATPDRGQRAAIAEGVLEALAGALDQLEGLRQRDGAAARQDIGRQLSELATLRERIAELTRDVPAARARKIEQQIARLGVEIPAERVAQEAALLAERADINEELARLESHLAQLTTMLDETGPIGRKFEFMLQEANREVNTIASKAGDATVARDVVEAKSCLEKMREQIQNVE